MKATEAKMLDLLQESPQFIIPIYQRRYRWTEAQCRQLWHDILKAGTNTAVKVHFIGSIVYIEEDLAQATRRTPLLVIDGQQRLTTVTILLAALATILSEEGAQEIDDFAPAEIRESFLVNRHGKGEKHYKLLLSKTDKTTLKALVQPEDELPEDRSVRVMENYQFFLNLLRAPDVDLLAVCSGLSKLMIVDVALTRGQDNPQLIFESMNSTGLELSQADLIRNYILMGLETGQQTRLYEQFWYPMEQGFGQEEDNKHFDAFMRHYLTVKTGTIPKKDDVYESFKRYARSEDVDQQGVDALVKDVRAFAKYYCAMALGAEKDQSLNQAFTDLRELKVEVAYPFLLELYHDYKTGVLSADDFVQAVRYIEAYVFRRAICSIPTNSLNKTFATFSKSLQKENYLESIKAHFLKFPTSTYRRFPNDEEFIREMQTRDLYNFPRSSYWLRRFENFERKEYTPVNEYTIEHIMPQNKNLPKAWKETLGEDWERIHEMKLHTLGNLTLTGYNSEYRDYPFEEKKKMEGGFCQSTLKINQGLCDVEQWNEQAINERAQKLASQLPEIWAAPSLSVEVLERYQPAVMARATGYTLQDHPYLLRGHTQDLYQAFRKEVLALAPDTISEEFTKLYVAYKAETNFVDAVPQAQGLRLSLNMRFNEISDPDRKCTDVSNTGRWGNGDVEVRLNALDDLPYVIGLVRQSLEKQLGNGENE